MARQRQGSRWARVLSRLIAVMLVVCACLFAVGAWYFGDYYHADVLALQAVGDADGAADGVTVRTLGDGSLAFVPDDPRAGLVLYPGAKVEPSAYAVLAERLAHRGLLVVLSDPPLNVAMLDADAADVAMQAFGDIDRWFVGGHSLGGVVASGYAARHQSEVSGIVLLASYPTDDLSTYEGSVLSAVGTNDAVLNRDAYNDARDKLPKDTKELVIEGGNHAGFANYGAQQGDGEASVSSEEQQEQTVEAIVGML